jgi:hypothetical protein
MSAPRQLHTATLLPSGRVLVAGGFDGAATLSSAERYDPASNTWSAVPSMLAPRQVHQATLLDSGKVLVLGGQNAAYLASTEVFDPINGLWSANVSMGTPRAWHSATRLDGGEILVAGGRLGSSALAGAERYALCSAGACCDSSLPTDGMVCVTLQQGTFGAVSDATLWQNTPGLNDAASATLSTGTSSSGVRRSLIHFDLAPLPAQSTVMSAALSVHQLYKDAASVTSVHRVTAPWSAATVTWSSLGSGFDPAVEGSFHGAAGSAGFRTIDASSLAGGWVSGALPNHGVLLQEPAVTRTNYRSSDSPNTSERPSLQVCYVACDDGVRNGDEERVDCGGPTCAPCPPIGTSCSNGVQDGGETGVDCGGQACAPCCAAP